MIGQELVLVFIEDKAYLASDRPLSFGQLGLPDIASTFKAPAFWTIKVLNYQEDQKKLFCEITAYENGSREFSQQQQDLAEQLQHIERVTFHSIDTTGLLKTMEGKATERIRPVRFVPVQRPEIPSKPAAIAPQRYVYRETFSVPLKEVRFKLGGVAVHRKFKKYPQTIELTIANYDLREEFDAIKNYFANVLQSKKIQVTATIHILEGIVVEKEATSPEIDRIDQQLIDNVKFDFVKATVKKQLKVEIDKSLFTMDEYFDTFADEKFQSNTFYKNDRELFEDLLTISKTKHYKHLRFLSSKHAYEIMKLRFVHKPFSFIFLIEGDRNYHVIWETLDTEEATYIWHLPKNLQVLKMTIRKVEDIINIIKVQGKTAYIAATEDAFRRIYHDYSELADGFVKWKGELEHFLT